MKKRCLSLLLAAAMLCTMLPVQAFAADPVPTPETAGSAQTAETPTDTPASPETADTALASPETANETEAVPETTPETAPEATPEATPETAGEEAEEPEQTPETAPEAPEAAVLSLDEGEPLAFGEDELMQVSDPGSVKLTLRFREKGVAFEGSDSELRNSFWFLRPDELTTEDWSSYKFTLTGPGGFEAKDAFTLAGTNSKYGLLTGQKPSQPGEYKLTVTDAKGKLLAEDSATIVAVVFDLDNKGTFADEDNTHTSYYEKTGSKFDAYLERSAVLPAVTVTASESGDHIGWAAEAGQTTVKDTWRTTLYDVHTVISDLTPEPEYTYTVHAVYGEKKTYGFRVDRDGKTFDWASVPLGPADLNYAPDRYALTLDLYSTGTSNAWVTLTQIKGPSTDWTVEFFDNNGSSLGNFSGGDVDLKGEGQYRLVIKPRAGLTPGTYSGTLQFRVSPLSMICTIQFNFLVNSNKILVTVPDTDKEYGRTLAPTDIEGIKVCYAGSGAPCDIPVEELGLDITSEGFLAGAAAGESYDYKVGSTSKAGFEVEAKDCGKVKVIQSMPAHSDVNATSVHEGSTLSASQLSGSFTNPYNSGEVVGGTLEWASDINDPSQPVTGEVGSKKPYTWRFTPTDGKNYLPVTGEASVEITTKKTTVLSLRPNSGSTSVAYDRKPHTLTFQSDRVNDPTGIKVEYYRQDAGGAWEQTPMEGEPIDAGTYEARASIAESTEYAAATMTETLTITPLPVTVSVDQSGPQTYNGKTDVLHPGAVRLQGVLSGDGNRVKLTQSSFRLESPNANDQAPLLITLGELEGEAAGNYKLPEDRTIRKYVTVYPAPLALTNAPTITKEYGERRLLSADDYAAAFAGQLLDDDTVADLGLTFRCEGERADADVNGGTPYPITVTMTGPGPDQKPNYTFTAARNNFTAVFGSIVVTKATPVENGISVGAGHRGYPLSHASLTGSFVNPNKSDMPVLGKLEWADPEKILPDDGSASYEAEWKFTPDDQKNYNIPKNGTVTITLQDRDPVYIEVTGETDATYTGQPHPLTAAITPTARYQVGYRPKGSTGDWTTEAPVHAGEYEALIAAEGATDASGKDFAPNQLVAYLTIEKAAPTVEVLEDPLEVPQGTLLDSELVRGNFAFTFNGRKVDGTLTWDHNGPAITEDCTLVWAFLPDRNEDGGVLYEDFKLIGGTAKFTVARDNRPVPGQVYNLPELPGYRDYAVVRIDSGENALRAGDAITFFKDEACTDPVSEAVAVTETDVKNGSLIVWLDGDALEHNVDGTVYARITSSVNGIVSYFKYSAEPGFELTDTGGGPAESIMVHPGIATNVTAKLFNEDIYKVESVDFVLTNADGIAELDTADSATDRTRALTGKNQGSGATLTVTVKFRHPDTVGHSGEFITLTDTATVACAGTIDAEPGTQTAATATVDPDTAREALETDNDRKDLAEGKKITYRLDVVEADSGTPDAQQEQNDVKTAANALGYEVGCHLDITITRYVNDDPDSGTNPGGPAVGDDGKIPTTPKPLTITIEIPAGVLEAANAATDNDPEFAVYRMHDGTIDRLPDLDGNGNDTVTIQTDKFSLYSIVYHKAPHRQPDPPAEDTSDDKDTHDKSSVAAPAVKPVVTIPQTADESSPALWRFAFLVSALGLCVTGFCLIRRRRKNK